VPDLPPAVRQRALAAGAEDWLNDLSALVADLEQAWSISVGRPFEDSTEAFVAEVTQRDGTPAVLKLRIPTTSTTATPTTASSTTASSTTASPTTASSTTASSTIAEHEIATLLLTDGEGCVRLLREDADRGALLLERLGRPLHQLGLPIQRRHDILCATAAAVWRPAAGCGLPTGWDQARGLINFITTTWEALDRPCTERAVDHALASAARRIDAHNDERAVLIHGDVHQWNALEASGSSGSSGSGSSSSSGNLFKLINPVGLLAEPEYDLGIIMREDPMDLLEGDPPERAQQRARWLARQSGLDATAIWEWGVVERVATGLLATQIGLQPVGAEMLAVADRLAG
jgi:streptomycin 6-kinase